VRVRYVSVGPGSCGTRPAYGVRPYDAPILLDRVPASVRHSTRGQFRGRAEREPTRPCGGEFFNPHPPQCRHLITERNGASHTTSVACPTHTGRYAARLMGTTAPAAAKDTNRGARNSSEPPVYESAHKVTNRHPTRPGACPLCASGMRPHPDGPVLAARSALPWSGPGMTCSVGSPEKDDAVVGAACASGSPA
jgi:hypothetical protein